jgi:hypothetical protein
VAQLTSYVGVARGLVAHGAATVSTISVGATRGHGLLDDNLGVKTLV